MTEQIAPKSHLGRIIRLILVLKFQFTQSAMGITVGDDAHDLGVATDLFGEVFDALALRDGLGYALGVGIDAIRRDLLGVAVAVNIVVVGIDQLSHSAIDRQIAQPLTAVIDVNFAQSLFDGIRREGRAGEHSEHHDNGEQHTHNSFFHDILVPP